MKRCAVILVSLLFFVLLAGCDSKVERVQSFSEADMVVYGNQIYTANENGEFVKAFAVKSNTL